MSESLRTYIKSVAIVSRGEGRKSRARGVSLTPATDKLLELLTAKLGNRYRSETIEDALITLGEICNVKPEDIDSGK